MKNFKLRIYITKGSDKGNLDHEELFSTLEEMKARYNALYQRELLSLNATAWEHKELIEKGINWGLNWWKVSDAIMQN